MNWRPAAEAPFERDVIFAFHDEEGWYADIGERCGDNICRDQAGNPYIFQPLHWAHIPEYPETPEDA